MPLPLPTLDRLTYDELVSEARSSLPALAPEWTDYNAHDPGITLLELFAWLAESNSYRLDQISESSYRAFLRLAGVTPRAAQVADTALVFEPDIAGAVALANGIQVETKDGKTVFQTQAPVYVSTAKLEVVLSATGASFDDMTQRNDSATPFLPFGSRPQPGDALYLGLDAIMAPEDTEISLWVFTGSEEKDYETRAQLKIEHEAVLADTKRWCPESSLANVPDWSKHYGARTVWECYADNNSWQLLKDVVDETRALTLSGAVRFKSPAAATHVAGGVQGSAHTGQRFIRCRFAQGAYDCPPRIVKVAINAVLARHAAAVPQETFRSSGHAQQTISLSQKPVVPGSTQLNVKVVGGADEQWVESSSFDGYGPHDRIYILLSEDGIIRFGNGRIGRVPSAEAEINVKYSVGATTSGNLSPKTLVRVKANNSVIEVSQPFAAFGGAAAETLYDAQARAVRELHARNRAVTLADCEHLALTTPGVPVARAHAIADYHPRMNCIAVSGSTTVVVLPRCPEQRPEPTAAMLATVQRYLEPRRVLTGELHVVGPQYTVIAVSATLHTSAEVDRRDLVRRAREALSQFFHPLRGGSNGSGYPIGRAAYRAEVLALLNELEGVQCVEDLSWRVNGGNTNYCANVAICRHGLWASGVHEITTNEGSGCHV